MVTEEDNNKEDKKYEVNDKMVKINKVIKV